MILKFGIFICGIYANPIFNEQESQCSTLICDKVNIFREKKFSKFSIFRKFSKFSNFWNLLKAGQNLQKSS